MSTAIQKLDAVEIGKRLDAEIAAMPSDQLAEHVRDGIGGVYFSMAMIAPYIQELWRRFETLGAGESISGCRTKKEYCETVLNRTPRAVRYMLAGGNPVSKRNPSKEGETVSPQADANKRFYGEPEVEEAESLTPHMNALDAAVRTIQDKIQQVKSGQLRIRHIDSESRCSHHESLLKTAEELAAASYALGKFEPAKRFKAAAFRLTHDQKHACIQFLDEAEKTGDPSAISTLRELVHIAYDSRHLDLGEPGENPTIPPAETHLAAPEKLDTDSPMKVSPASTLSAGDFFIAEMLGRNPRKNLHYLAEINRKKNHVLKYYEDGSWKDYPAKFRPGSPLLRNQPISRSLVESEFPEAIALLDARLAQEVEAANRLRERLAGQTDDEYLLAAWRITNPHSEWKLQFDGYSDEARITADEWLAKLDAQKEGVTDSRLLKLITKARKYAEGVIRRTRTVADRDFAKAGVYAGQFFLGDISQYKTSVLQYVVRVKRTGKKVVEYWDTENQSWTPQMDSTLPVQTVLTEDDVARDYPQAFAEWKEVYVSCQSPTATTEATAGAQQERTHAEQWRERLNAAVEFPERDGVPNFLPDEKSFYKLLDKMAGEAVSATWKPGELPDPEDIADEGTPPEPQTYTFKDGSTIELDWYERCASTGPKAPESATVEATA